MTISSSLNAGVSGLMANATQLATISDNIANANTSGYKTVSTEFYSMVLGSESGYSAGGVTATTTRGISESGSHVSTDSATDISVTGTGFIPVAELAEVETGNDPEMLLTSTGSFSTNADGYLTTSSGLVLMGWPATSGEIGTVSRDSDASLEPIQFNTSQVSADPTTAVTLSVNLPATETEDTSSGDSYEMNPEYFDNLGGSENLTIEFVPTVPASGDPDSNEWTMIITDSATDDGATTIGEYTLTFDDSRTDSGTLASVVTTTGTAYDTSSGSIIVDTGSGEIEITIGEIGSASGMTQVDAVFTGITSENDGSAAANFEGVEIDESGMVYALYDNGSSRLAYQVPLANMSNADGMETYNSQTYAISNESGAFYLYDAGDGPAGSIDSYSLEESTVDIATQLTDMIVTQRAYSSNATVIQTVDEMLQETTGLKR